MRLSVGFLKGTTSPGARIDSTTDGSGFFGEFRGTGQSFPGRPCRRLPEWTHLRRTMPVFWALTTPGESMLLTFGSMSGESKSGWRTLARAFSARNAASPAGWPITRKSGVGGTSTRCSSRRNWSPDCRGAAARITG